MNNIENKKLNTMRKGSLLVFLGAVLWSTNAPFFKILQVDSYLAIAIRAAIAGILCLPSLRHGKIHFNCALAVMLCSYTTLCVGIVFAIRNTSVNIATGMQYTSPLLIFCLGVFRKKIRPTFRRHWPMLLLLGGLVVSMLSGSEAVTKKGNLWALSTAASFTLMTLSSKKSGADNPLGIVCLNSLFCAVAVALLFVPKPLAEQLKAISYPEWLSLIYLGVFQIGAGYALYYSGLRQISPGRAAMIAPVEMVLGPVWVALFVREYPDWIAVLGSVLIVAGVLGEVIAGQKSSAYVPEKSVTKREEKENSTAEIKAAP